MHLKLLQPQVFLIGSTKLNYPGLNSYLSALGLQEGLNLSQASDGELLATIAGKLCYKSLGKGRSEVNEYLDNILSLGHFSVIEHSTYTLLITGVSRSLSHELVRHRLLSVSQESQRYVDDADMGFVAPSALSYEVNPDPTEQTAGDVWVVAVQEAQEAYKNLVARLMKLAPPDLSKTERRKWSRQAARSVLPNATGTTIVITGNARTFRHILTLRGGPSAEPEIRRLACLMLEVLKNESPLLFDDFEEHEGNILTSKYKEL